MIKFTKFFSIGFISIFLFLSLSLSASAQLCSECYMLPEDQKQACLDSCDNSGAAIPTNDGSGTPAGSVALPDPLGIKDPRDIIENVIKAMLGLVGSLALAVFIYGGFTWVISAGNEEKIKKGKDMIMWAALGLMLIFTSYALINLVLTSISGNATPSIDGPAQPIDGGAADVIPG